MDEWMTKQCNLSINHAIELMICAAHTGIKSSRENIQHLETRCNAQLQWDLGHQMIMWGMWY